MVKIFLGASSKGWAKSAPPPSVGPPGFGITYTGSTLYLELETKNSPLQEIFSYVYLEAALLELSSLKNNGILKYQNLEISI